MERLLSSQTQPVHITEQVHLASAVMPSCKPCPWQEQYRSPGQHGTERPKQAEFFMHAGRRTIFKCNCRPPGRCISPRLCNLLQSLHTHLQPLVGADSKPARPLTLPQRNGTAPFPSCCKTCVVLAAAWPSLIHSFAAHLKAPSPTAAGCRSHYARLCM